MLDRETLRQVRDAIVSRATRAADAAPEGVSGVWRPDGGGREMTR